MGTPYVSNDDIRQMQTDFDAWWAALSDADKLWYIKFWTTLRRAAEKA